MGNRFFRIHVLGVGVFGGKELHKRGDFFIRSLAERFQGDSQPAADLDKRGDARVPGAFFYPVKSVIAQAFSPKISFSRFCKAFMVMPCSLRT